MNPAFGPEGPSRLDLDAVCPDKPIILESSDHHTAWANTQAIRVCGITKETTVPDGDVIERDSDGFPSGTFRELTAMSLLDKARMKIGKSEYKEAFRKLQDFFAERGITTIYDALVHPNDGFLDAIFEMAETASLSVVFVALLQQMKVRHILTLKMQNYIAKEPCVIIISSNLTM